MSTCIKNIPRLSDIITKSGNDFELVESLKNYLSHDDVNSDEVLKKYYEIIKHAGKLSTTSFPIFKLFLKNSSEIKYNHISFENFNMFFDNDVNRTKFYKEFKKDFYNTVFISKNSTFCDTSQIRRGILKYFNDISNKYGYGDLFKNSKFQLNTYNKINKDFQKVFHLDKNTEKYNDFLKLLYFQDVIDFKFGTYIETNFVNRGSDIVLNINLTFKKSVNQKFEDTSTKLNEYTSVVLKDWFEINSIPYDRSIELLLKNADPDALNEITNTNNLTPKTSILSKITIQDKDIAPLYKLIFDKTNSTSLINIYENTLKSDVISDFDIYKSILNVLTTTVIQNYFKVGDATSKDGILSQVTEKMNRTYSSIDRSIQALQESNNINGKLHVEVNDGINTVIYEDTNITNGNIAHKLILTLTDNQFKLEYRINNESKISFTIDSNNINDNKSIERIINHLNEQFDLNSALFNNFVNLLNNVTNIPILSYNNDKLATKTDKFNKYSSKGDYVYKFSSLLPVVISSNALYSKKISKGSSFFSIPFRNDDVDTGLYNVTKPSISGYSNLIFNTLQEFGNIDDVYKQKQTHRSIETQSGNNLPNTGLTNGASKIPYIIKSKKHTSFYQTSIFKKIDDVGKTWQSILGSDIKVVIGENSFIKNVKDLNEYDNFMYHVGMMSNVITISGDKYYMVQPTVYSDKNTRPTYLIPTDALDNINFAETEQQSMSNYYLNIIGNVLNDLDPQNKYDSASAINIADKVKIWQKIIGDINNDKYTLTQNLRKNIHYQKIDNKFTIPPGMLAVLHKYSSVDNLNKWNTAFIIDSLLEIENKGFKIKRYDYEGGEVESVRHLFLNNDWVSNNEVVFYKIKDDNGNVTNRSLSDYKNDFYNNDGQSNYKLELNPIYEKLQGLSNLFANNLMAGVDSTIINYATKNLNKVQVVNNTFWFTENNLKIFSNWTTESIKRANSFTATYIQSVKSDNGKTTLNVAVVQDVENRLSSLFSHIDQNVTDGATMRNSISLMREKRNSTLADIAEIANKTLYTGNENKYGISWLLKHAEFTLTNETMRKGGVFYTNMFKRTMSIPLTNVDKSLIELITLRNTFFTEADVVYELDKVEYDPSTGMLTRTATNVNTKEGIQKTFTFETLHDLYVTIGGEYSCDYNRTLKKIKYNEESLVKLFQVVEYSHDDKSANAQGKRFLYNYLIDMVSFTSAVKNGSPMVNDNDINKNQPYDYHKLQLNGGVQSNSEKNTTEHVETPEATQVIQALAQGNTAAISNIVYDSISKGIIKENEYVNELLKKIVSENPELKNQRSEIKKQLQKFVSDMFVNSYRSPSAESISVINEMIYLYNTKELELLPTSDNNVVNILTPVIAKAFTNRIIKRTYTGIPSILVPSAFIGVYRTKDGYTYNDNDKFNNDLNLSDNVVEITSEFDKRHLTLYSTITYNGKTDYIDTVSKLQYYRGLSSANMSVNLNTKSELRPSNYYTNYISNNGTAYNISLWDSDILMLKELFQNRTINIIAINLEILNYIATAYNLSIEDSALLNSAVTGITNEKSYTNLLSKLIKQTVNSWRQNEIILPYRISIVENGNTTAKVATVLMDDYECLIPNIYKTKYEFTKFDSLYDVQSKKEMFFYDKLINKYNWDSIGQDQVLFDEEGSKYAFIKAESENGWFEKNKSRLKVKEINVVTENDVTYKVDENGDKMYNINGITEYIFINDDGKSYNVIVFDDIKKLKDYSKLKFNIFKSLKDAEELGSNLINLATKQYASFMKGLNFNSARIPTQGMSSFMKMKAVGFIDSDVNAVYVPAMQLWLQGSDYDIDKAFLSTYSINNNGIINKYSPFFNYENEDELDASLSLPLPNKSKIGLSFISGIVDIPNTSLVLNLTTAQYLFTEGEFQTIDAYYNKTISNLPSEILKKLSLILNSINYSKDTVQNIYVQNDIVTKMITEHNSFSFNSNDVKNNIIHNIMKASSSIDNYEMSTKAISIDEIEEAILEISRSKPSVNSLKSVGDYLGLPLTEHLTVDGKRIVGIIASIMKITGGISYYMSNELSRQIESNTLSETNAEKRILLAGANFPSIHKNPSKNVNSIGRLSIPLNYQNNTDIKSKIEGVFHKTIDELTESDIIDRLSQLLGAATDNAKNAVLSKINCSVDTAGIYGYLITMGYTIPQIAMYLVDPNITTLMRLNRNSTFDKYMQLEQFLTNVLSGNSWKKSLDVLEGIGIINKLNSENFISQFGKDLGIHNLKLEKTDYNGRNLSLDAFTKRLTRNTNISKEKLIEVFKKHFVEDGMIISATFDDEAGDMFFTMEEEIGVTYNNADKKSQSTEFKINDYINFIYELDTVKIDKIVEFSSIVKGTNEMLILSKIFKLNQQIPSTIAERKMIFIAFDNYINTIIPPTKDDKTLFSLKTFVLSDDSVKKLWISKLDRQTKGVINFNVLDVITKIPHFYSMLETLVTMDGLMNNTSYLDRIVSKWIDDLEISKKSVSGVENEIKKLQNYINHLTIYSFYLNEGRNYEFQLESGDKFVNSTWALQDVSENRIMTLNSNYNIATFKYFVEQIALPYLQKNNPQNSFINKLKIQHTTNHLSGKIQSMLITDADMSNLEDQDNLQIYSDMREGLQKLKGETFRGMNVVEIFYHYSLIMNKNRNSSMSLINLFNNQEVTGKKDFLKYESNLDTLSDKDLENTLLFNTTDARIFTSNERFTTKSRHNVFPFDNLNEIRIANAQGDAINKLQLLSERGLLTISQNSVNEYVIQIDNTVYTTISENNDNLSILKSIVNNDEIDLTILDGQLTKLLSINNTNDPSYNVNSFAKNSLVDVENISDLNIDIKSIVSSLKKDTEFKYNVVFTDNLKNQILHVDKSNKWFLAINKDALNSDSGMYIVLLKMIHDIQNKKLFREIGNKKLDSHLKSILGVSNNNITNSQLLSRVIEVLKNNEQSDKKSSIYNMIKMIYNVEFTDGNDFSNVNITTDLSDIKSQISVINENFTYSVEILDSTLFENINFNNNITLHATSSYKSVKSLVKAIANSNSIKTLNIAVSNGTAKVYDDIITISKLRGIDVNFYKYGSITISSVTNNVNESISKYTENTAESKVANDFIELFYDSNDLQNAPFVIDNSGTVYKKNSETKSEVAFVEFVETISTIFGIDVKIDNSISNSAELAYEGDKATIYIKNTGDTKSLIHELAHVWVAIWKMKDYPGYLKYLNTVKLDSKYKSKLDDISKLYPGLNSVDLNEETLVAIVSDTLIGDNTYSTDLKSLWTSVFSKIINFEGGTFSPILLSQTSLTDIVLEHKSNETTNVLRKRFYLQQELNKMINENVIEQVECV